MEFSLGLGLGLGLYPHYETSSIELVYDVVELETYYFRAHLSRFHPKGP